MLTDETDFVMRLQRLPTDDLLREDQRAAQGRKWYSYRLRLIRREIARRQGESERRYCPTCGAELYDLVLPPAREEAPAV